MCISACVCVCVITLSSFLLIGFYVQPDVLFLSEHPLSQLVFEGADFSLNCAVQLRGLTENEGGLNVPVVWWSFNNTRISSDVCLHQHHNDSVKHFLCSFILL